MRGVSHLLFVFCFIAFTLASCHHDCYDHGECVDNSCVCSEGWAGSDCSIPFLPLTNQEPVSMSVDGSWIYFYTDITSNPSSMTYTLNDDIFGDCDLYISLEEFPSKSHHQFGDNGWNSVSTITIDHPDNGRWIAGVYNFLSCDFTFVVEIENEGDCLNDCSGHGTCDTFNVCHCDDLWGGDDCSQEFVELADGVDHEDSVEHWQWKMYFFDSVAEDGLIPAFQIVVNQTGVAAGDTDLYVKFEEAPTLFYYDYRNAAVVDNYALTIGNPEEGRYYIGIYGYNAADYTIHVDVIHDSDCDNPCSSHGYCSNNMCTCVGPFNGDNCEYMTEDLEEGESVLGFAGDNQWNYYTATANSATNMMVTIDQDWNIGGDCDLYIRADTQPDRFHYDYRNIGFDNSFDVVVQNPLSTHWYIGVYGYRSCQYFIRYSLDAASCPNACSNHGNCVNGRCACSSGYAGQDCGSPLTRIHSGDLLEGNIGQNKWHYYKYTAPSVHTSITVELIEVETNGYMGLYMLEGAPPELTGSQYSDTAISNLHNIYFQFDGTADVDHDFYIGVYGNSHVALGSPSPYKVFVYSPPI